MYNNVVQRLQTQKKKMNVQMKQFVSEKEAENLSSKFYTFRMISKKNELSDYMYVTGI